MFCPSVLKRSTTTTEQESSAITETRNENARYETVSREQVGYEIFLHATIPKRRLRQSLSDIIAGFSTIAW